ncbi:MAG: TetR/AcrR family transcriptional regulator [Deltaproteobacteria bacterium]|nr:TetR/AcrR family transcriptional regulator [Deltaproteobacteria bacterium]
MVRKKLNKDEITSFQTRSIEAARQLFMDGGLEAMTMRNIAKQLNCSPMAPYRYFENLEALVAALRASLFEIFTKYLNDAMSANLKPKQRIGILAKTYLDYALENPTDYKLMFDLAPPKVACMELEKQSALSFEPLRVAARELAFEGVLSVSAETYAHLLWAQLHGLVSLYLSRKLNFGMSIEALVDAFLTQLNGTLGITGE